MSTATMDIATKPREVTRHVSTIDWSTVSAGLDAQGWAVLPKLLSANECDSGAVSRDLPLDEGAVVLGGFARSIDRALLDALAGSSATPRSVT